MVLSHPSEKGILAQAAKRNKRSDSLTAAKAAHTERFDPSPLRTARRDKLTGHVHRAASHSQDLHYSPAAQPHAQTVPALAIPAGHIRRGSVPAAVKLPPA